MIPKDCKRLSGAARSEATTRRDDETYHEG